MKLKTLGIWMNNPREADFKSEGLGRFTFYLTKGLVKRRKINIEIWYNRINDYSVKELFSGLMNDPKYREHIKLVNEESFDKTKITRYYVFKKAFRKITRMLLYNEIVSWKRPYQVYRENYSLFSSLDVIISPILLSCGFITKGLKMTILKNMIIKKSNNILPSLANKYSRADCFLISLLTLDDALRLNKPKVVLLHDLIPLEFEKEFILSERKNKEWIEKIKRAADAFAKQNVFFSTISEYVRKNHILKYVKNIKESNTGFIYHPVFMQGEINRDSLNKKEAYIFYPTQIRPHKDIITLLKAFKRVRDKKINLKLVLTGDIKGDKKALEYAKRNKLMKYIEFRKGVSENELINLSKNAKMVVVPSLAEGGFPLQGLEAISLDIPVVMARIPVTIERLNSVGLNPENCGIRLFEPKNDEELAEKILRVLNDRENVVLKQKKAKDKLMARTWDDASEDYYKLLSKICERQNN